MAAMLSKTELGMKKTTTDLKYQVEETDVSKLMYYVNCVATVLRLDDPEISRLRDYKRSRNMTPDDVNKLIIFCMVASPDVLLNKVFFQDDSMCHEYQNEFYNLNIARTTLAVTDNIVIGGQRKQVMKIMCFTKSWLKENYIEPFTNLTADIVQEDIEKVKKKKSCAVM